MFCRTHMLTVAWTVAVAGLFAKTNEVGDVWALQLSNGDVAAAVSTSIPEILPDAGTPIFHLDASQTNEWTIDGGMVSRIPSLVGSRYLVSGEGKYIHELSKRDEANGLWDASDYWQLKLPQVAHDEDICAAVLDFGALGSRMAMLFDYENDLNSGMSQPTNVLRGIGTVVAVWRQAGGAILGGGMGLNGGGDCNGQMWVRGTSMNCESETIASQRTTNPDSSSPLLWCPGSPTGGYNNMAFNPALNGISRENGIPANTWLTGRTADWTVTSLLPTNNLGNANGLGLGIVRQNESKLSGGLKIAEMVIYGETLDVFRVKQVEDYLAKKWLGRSRYGTDGRSRMLSVAGHSKEKSRNGVRTEINVPDGASLELGEYAGGRGTGASIDKTGNGVLSVSDLRNYPGKLAIKEGTLRFGGRHAATAIPVAPFLHFDVSESNSVTTETIDGVKYVKRMANIAESSYRGERISAKAGESPNPPPVLVEGVFTAADGSQMSAVNLLEDRRFGTSAETSGAYFRFVNSKDEGLSIDGLTTVIAVVSPGAKGGTLLGNVRSCAADPSATYSTGCYFDRDQDTIASWSSYAAPLLGTKPFARIHPTLVPTNGIVMIDGVKRDVRAGYDRQGFQVVALQVPGSCVSSIGASFNSAYAGGFMFSEIAIYSHPLSEEELRDVSAYMSAKWLGRSIPGYLSASGMASPPIVQDLLLEDGTTVDVPSGMVARVRLADFSTSFTKTGGGSLQIENPSNIALVGAKLREGTIDFVAPLDHDAESGYAVSPSLHLDADETNRMDFASDGKTVKAWYDIHRRDGVSAFAGVGYPALIAAACTNRQRKIHNAVTFGGFRSGARAELLRPLHGVRSAYIVAARGAANAHIGALLGTASAFCNGNGSPDEDVVDFFYGTDSNGWPSSPFSPVPTKGATVRYNCGETLYFTNGVSVSAAQNVLPPTDEFDYRLYEVHLPVGAHVSALCGIGTNPNYSGGWRYGEILLYERELSEREKVATRNHLARKWLGVTDEGLSPLPEPAPQPDQCVLANLDVEDGASMSVQEGRTLTYGQIVGTGDFAKIGGGTLAVNDIVGFTGTVSVAEGAFRICHALPPEEPAMPDASKGLAVHLDASRADTMSICESNGTMYVNEWRSLTGNGMRAVPRGGDGKTMLVSHADLRNSMDAVKMPDNESSMVFKDAEGNRFSVTNVLSVLWVLGSHDGGGTILGNEFANPKSGSADGWFRGAQTYGSRPEDFLIYSGACAGVRTAEFCINDRRLSAGTQLWPEGVTDATPLNTGLSGGWDFISCRVHEGTYANAVSADSLAYNSTASGARSGHQRLAEILIYTNMLTAAECRRAGYAMRAKWGLERWQRSMSNAVHMVVGADAELDLGGTNQYLNAIGGAGRIVNGNLSVSGMDCDFASTGCLEMEGTLTVGDGFTLNLMNVDAVRGGFADLTIPLIRASMVVGAENLSRFTVKGEELPKYVRVRLRAGKNGEVVARFFGTGLKIHVF